MPPSHFVDLRLVKTNLDKEGLKFQLEEHAVARILEVWGSCAKTQQRKVLTSGNLLKLKEICQKTFPIHEVCHADHFEVESRS